MANETGAARSNYFRVKDETKFRACCSRLGLEVRECDTLIDGQKQFAVFMDGETWPLSAEDPQTGEEYELSVSSELAEHLHDDDVAIFMDICSDDPWHIDGYAVAVNSRGQIEEVGLRMIYDRAGHLGKRMTACEC